MNSASLGPLLLLNVSFLLISTSGVLGRSIVLDPWVVIFYRSLLAVVIFAVYFLGKRQGSIFLGLKKKSTWIAGFLMAAHWVTYFYALQWSNVAIGMLSLFTYPVITALLEPLFFSTRYNKVSLALAMFMLVGVYLLVPEFTLENRQFKAVGMGVFSALCFATRNLVLKKEAQQESGLQMMFYQVIIVAFFLLPFAHQNPFTEVIAEWENLVLLALLTTVLGHSLFLQSLKHFTVTRASLISCVQPLYGIILAAIFINEMPNGMTLLGGLIILLSVGVEIQMNKN